MSVTPARQWWQLFGTHGEHIWLLQPVCYLVAIGLILFLFPLSLTFGWVGIGFFVMIAGGISGIPASWLFGGLFLFVGILFAVDTRREKVYFRLPKQRGRR